MDESPIAPTPNDRRERLWDRGSNIKRAICSLTLAALLVACSSTPGQNTAAQAAPTASAISASPSQTTGIDTTELGSVFRGLDELPVESRSALEARLTAVRPTNFDGLSSQQRADWAEEFTWKGLVRLDDAALTARFRLRASAVGHMPEATCATFWRNMKNRVPTTDLVLSALSVDQRRDWYEIAVEAIEAQVSGTPVPRVVTLDEVRVIAAKSRSLATPEELLALDSPATSDAAECASIRAVNATTLRLPAADLATVSRQEVQQ